MSRPKWGIGRIAIFVVLTAIPVLILLPAMPQWMTVLHDWEEVGASRRSAIAATLAKIQQDAALMQVLGAPVAVAPGTHGSVTVDTTGWQEARLLIPVRGKDGQAVARIAAGRVKGAWTYSTFQVLFAKSRTSVDLLAGKVTHDDASVSADVKKLPAAPVAFMAMKTPPPEVPADFPCVVGGLGANAKPPRLTMCPIDADPGGPVDEAEADFRQSAMVLRETDLYVDDVFQVPLTRTYTSWDWATPDHVHAFGINTNDYWDIAPRGTRFPYTFQYLVLADGDVLYFRRVSVGGRYDNAVFQHTQTDTRFYKATERWNGNGWTTRLTDGEEIFFPESYSARSLAQGAATEIRNGQGDVLKLQRDAKRNLKEILTPHGKWIRFTYDGESRVIRAEDDAGHWAQYGYNRKGLLTAVRLSTGKARYFSYWSGARMAEITDGHGKVLLKNWYRGGELIRQVFGDGEEFQYRYEPSKNGRYFTKVYVTLPDHSVKEIDEAKYIPETMKKYGW